MPRILANVYQVIQEKQALILSFTQDRISNFSSGNNLNVFDVQLGPLHC